MYKLDYYCTHFNDALLLPPSDQIAVIKQVTGCEVTKYQAYQLITALASDEWYKMRRFAELKQFIADKYHPYEIILRGCAQLFHISPQLPIDYKQLILKMENIVGASDHIIIDVDDSNDLIDMEYLKDTGDYYELTHSMARLFASGSLSFYGDDLYDNIWKLLEDLPIKLKHTFTGEISDLNRNTD